MTATGSDATNGLTSGYCFSSLRNSHSAIALAPLRLGSLAPSHPSSPRLCDLGALARKRICQKEVLIPWLFSIFLLVFLPGIALYKNQGWLLVVLAFQ